MLRSLIWAVIAMVIGTTACGAQQAGLRDGDVVLCFGDSITEQAESSVGYVTQLRRIVAERHPDWKVQILASGFSGGGAGYAGTLLKAAAALTPETRAKADPKVVRLADNIAAKPTVVIFVFGVNDICNSTVSRLVPSDEDKLMKSYWQTIDDVRAIVKPRELWLSPPLSAGERDTTPKNEMILRYGPALRAGAAAHGALVLGTQDEFWKQVAACRELWSGMRFTVDGVHPNGAGHLLLAEVMLHDLGVTAADGQLPSPLSYLPPAQRDAINKGGVALSYDIPETDTDKTTQTRFPWHLYLTNVTDKPLAVSLTLTLPEGLQAAAGAPPAQVQLPAGGHQEFTVQVAGPLSAETTVCTAAAQWQRDGAPYQAEIKAELHAPWLVLVPLRGNPFLVQTQPTWGTAPNPAEFKPEPPAVDLAQTVPDPVTGQATHWRKYVNHSPWVNTASQEGIDFYNRLPA